MLTKEQIEFNKQRFIKLIKEIKRDGADIDGLINKLEKSDFFTAPASTQFHASFEGGLCFHCLNVYDQINKLMDCQFATYVNDGTNEIKTSTQCPYSQETLIIVSLLHDFSKMNFYETSTRNVKDEKGNWTKVPYIKVREASNRFTYSDHGVNSEYMTGRFIPLSLEESVAIIHHMGWSDEHANANLISEVFDKFPLAMYLHMADCLATYVDEKVLN